MKSQDRTIPTYRFFIFHSLFNNDRRKWFTEAKSELSDGENEPFSPSGIDRIKPKGGIMNTRR